MLKERLKNVKIERKLICQNYINKIILSYIKLICQNYIFFFNIKFSAVFFQRILILLFYLNPTITKIDLLIRSIYPINDL